MQKGKDKVLFVHDYWQNDYYSGVVVGGGSGVIVSLREGKENHSVGKDVSAITSGDGWMEGGRVLL